MSLRTIQPLAIVAAFATLTACSSVLGIPDLYQAETPSADGIGDGGGALDPDANPSSASSDGGGTPTPPTCNADLKSDPKNCGACTHDCTNGICKDGVCLLAQNLASPSSIAVRGNNVYVGLLGGTGDIVSCPTTGCASATVGLKDLTPAAAGDPYPWRIAATDTHVWASDYSSSNKGGVRRVAPAGADFQKYPPADLERSYGVAVDSSSVYWTTTGTPGAIHWCNLPACANGLQTATIALSDPELIAVAANGTIVWADNSGGRLRRCTSKTACTPADLVPDFQGVVLDLAIDGTTVYWGTNLGEILSCSVTGCANATKVTVEQPKGVIAAIAVSGTSLYWSALPYLADGNNVDATAGVIKSCTLPACTSPKVVATKQNDPSAMAVDAKSVYWANSGKRGFTDGIGNLLKAPR